MVNSLVQRGAPPQAFDSLRTLLRLPQLWLQRRAWRSELSALDAAQMRDCGLDPETVRREAAKPFWRS
ncbi:DUF1127 domain-containing protein [Bradyrhizobium sp.]|uniref:DUF1127 domain-containing protein n=1 Tax=Bradyrhizobium sp. TaxID=376 RepID=UPI003C6A7C22